MSKFIVSNDFWDIFPDAQVNVIVATDINNTTKDIEYLNGLLAEAVLEAGTFLNEPEFAQNEVIRNWRSAFAKIKTKKGARSSIEALLKRVSQGREFKSINPLVDIYNSVSLTYAVPCGGEDIDKLDGDLVLGKAKGGEAFLPLGATTDEPALPEEMIYSDNSGAVCRSLNWREAQRTMLTEDTKNAVFVIESTTEDEITRANNASNRLKNLINDNFDTVVIQATLTRANPSIVLN